VTGADPVKTGLVDSFSRPGGNLTGVFVLISMLGPKRLELLRELLPSISTIALLVNPSNPNVVDAPETEAAANAIGRRLEVLKASTEGDLEAAFTTMARRQAGALIVMPDPLFFARREQLVALAARYALPTIYPTRDFTEIGGLMSYGTNLSLDLAHQQGTYTEKILRGAKPADLPVQQSIRLELVINLKTAKALGLTIPPTLLARADDVIE
jgi:putative ABC transport system substrate-binding protein